MIDVAEIWRCLGENVEGFISIATWTGIAAGRTAVAWREWVEVDCHVDDSESKKEV